MCDVCLLYCTHQRLEMKSRRPSLPVNPGHVGIGFYVLFLMGYKAVLTSHIMIPFPSAIVCLLFSAFSMFCQL
jgi:hypothetical protein